MKKKIFENVKKYSIELSFGIALILIFATILFPWYELNGTKLGSKYELYITEYDKLGTFIAGISAPIIGLVSIYLLFKAYNLQKTELKDTKLALQEQSETIKKQRFEDTFFQLLTLHHNIVDKLKGSNNEYGNNFGSAILDLMVKDLYDYYYIHSTTIDMKDRFEQNRIPIEIKSQEHQIEIITKTFNQLFEKNQNILGHYFRNLYHIFKFIHLTNQIDEKYKQFYSNILRAHLSNSELVLIFYNCFIQGLGFPKFKFLVDRFDVLQNLNDGTVLNEMDLEIFKTMIISENPFKSEINDNIY